MKPSDRIIAFIESLKVPDGALVGQPMALRGWQKKIVRQVYDPKGADGLRLVRQALVTMGRKNGKTALIAGLCLAHLCGPGAVRNGELYSVAFDREQASQVFKYMRGMVEQDEELSARLNIIYSSKKIVDSVSGSIFQALSAESRSKHGKSTSFMIFDELARFGRDRELYDVMMTSRGAHTEPLVWAISTQAAEDAALFSELVDYGKKVNAGEIDDPTSKTFIFEVPPEADVWDERNWPLANPALGDFRSLKEMRETAQKAKRMPGQEAAFRNLYMNQRVSAEGRLIPPDVWKANAAEPDLDLFHDQSCWGGLDLSGKNDLTALVYVTRTREGKWAVLPYFWTPGGNILERADRDRAPYDLWARQGHLTATPGRTIDYAFVARQIAEMHGRMNIKGIKFDRWRIDDLQRALLAEGVDAWIDGKDEPVAGGLRLIPHGQGFRDMSPAIGTLEDLLLEGRLEHGNHPVLTMCAANVKAQSDPAGNRKFDKIKSTGRIDGIVALAMALNGAVGPEAAEAAESVYETRGFATL